MYLRAELRKLGHEGEAAAFFAKGGCPEIASTLTAHSPEHAGGESYGPRRLRHPSVWADRAGSLDPGGS
jgi:hypothetical protein